MTRSPTVSQGNPYQVEVGLIFGDGMAADKPVEVLRFANRVPLMYQQGGCLLTKAIESVDWRQYGLDQAGGRGVPKGPAAILVHLASTNVQFTSEAKEALADNGEVMDEVRKAMLEMGRGLRKHLEKKKRWSKSKRNSSWSTISFPPSPPSPQPFSTGPCPTLLAPSRKSWEPSSPRAPPFGTRKPSKPMFPSRCSITPPEPEPTPSWRRGQRGKGPPWKTTRQEVEKEATGVWAWKLETLEPGHTYTITYALSGLEKGDWTETDVFYRGSQEVIGASKMDEKLLEEIRRQEARAEDDQVGDDDSQDEAGTDDDESAEIAPPPKRTNHPEAVGNKP